MKLWLPAKNDGKIKGLLKGFSIFALIVVFAVFFPEIFGLTIAFFILYVLLS